MAQECLATLLCLNECQEIVQKYSHESNNNFHANSFSIVSATEAKGFLGNYFHLKIKCTKLNNAIELKKLDAECDAVLLKFFLKSLPPVDEDHEIERIFQKESYLYESLLPKLQKYSSTPWCPKVYLCYRNLLVLEDLNCLGFSTLASRETFTEKEMFPTLKALAAMHGSSLLYEFETGASIADLCGTNVNEITVHPDIRWFKTGLNAVLTLAKQHPKCQREGLQKFITTELPLHMKRVYAMVNPSLKYRNVLCHRDTWGGNIFLNHSDPLQPAIFVDFQTCRYCPPSIDVIFTLYMNLTKCERINKQSKYIKFYYQQLLEHIKKHISCGKSFDEVIFTEAELLESIEEFKLFGLIYKALAITVLNVPMEFVTDHYKNVERTERLLQYMNENEDFKRIMNESIEDIIEDTACVPIRENFYDNN